MRSFISSSERRSFLGCIGVFLLASLLFFGAGAAVYRLPAFSDRRASPRGEQSPDSSEFYPIPEQLDHHVLFHGTDRGAIDHLKSAEILFLGNSRMMWAMSQQRIRGFFAERGIRYYAMGFGWNEEDEFPGAVIARHDLHPRLVVINADRFFDHSASAHARAVMKEPRFDAWKLQLEARLSELLTSAIRRWVPRWQDWLENRRTVRYFRSRIDGTWLPVWRSQEPSSQRFVDSPEAKAPTPETVRIAREFIGRLKARGATVLLMRVPHPGGETDGAESLARSLEVPLISPRMREPATIDGSHLDAPSADQWVRRFLDQLDQSAEFRVLLKS